MQFRESISDVLQRQFWGYTIVNSVHLMFLSEESNSFPLMRFVPKIDFHSLFFYSIILMPKTSEVSQVRSHIRRVNGKTVHVKRHLRENSETRNNVGGRGKSRELFSWLCLICKRSFEDNVVTEGQIYGRKHKYIVCKDCQLKIDCNEIIIDITEDPYEMQIFNNGLIIYDLNQSRKKNNLE